MGARSIARAAAAIMVTGRKIESFMMLVASFVVNNSVSILKG